MPTAKMTTLEVTGTTSPTVNRRSYGDALGIMVQAPASLQGGITRTFEVSADGVTFATLVNAGGTVALPDAGKAIVYIDLISAYAWRIKYSGAPSAAEEWLVSKNWEP